MAANSRICVMPTEGDRNDAFMRRSIELAKEAEKSGDVPVGAVLLCGDAIFEGKNEKELRSDPTAHAEILVLREASRKLGAWRLSDATVYVTKEPCIMCAGAMVGARIKRLVYGCRDPRGGADGSVVNIVRNPALNHRIEVTPGILEAETAAQLQAFFQKRRQ